MTDNFSFSANPAAKYSTGRLHKLADMGNSITPENSEKSKPLSNLIELSDQVHPLDEEYKIGKLLILFKMVDETSLNTAVEQSYELNIPLGKVLTMNGQLTKNQVDSVVQLQSLLRENLISRQIAIQISDLLTSTSRNLAEAIDTVGCSIAVNKPRSRLGDLFCQAKIISQEELDQALKQSQSAALPMGKFLVLSGKVSVTLLELALNAQRLFREHKLSWPDTVESVRKAHIRHHSTNSNSLNRSYATSSLRRLKIGELLVLAGIVSEAQVNFAIENSITTNTPVGHVLIDLGLISESTLESALLLQVMVVDEALEPLEATCALIDIHHHGQTVVQALNNCNMKIGKKSFLDFKEFIAASEVISMEELDLAIEKAMASPYQIVRALSFVGALNATTLKLALCVHYYLREGMLSYDDAMQLFTYANKHNLSINESMQKLGFKLNI